MTVNLESIVNKLMATAVPTFRRALGALIRPQLQTTRHENTSINIVVGFFSADLVPSSRLSLREIDNPTASKHDTKNFLHTYITCVCALCKLALTSMF